MSSRPHPKRGFRGAPENRFVFRALPRQGLQPSGVVLHSGPDLGWNTSHSPGNLALAATAPFLRDRAPKGGCPARRGDVETVRSILQQDALYAYCMDDTTGETAFSAAWGSGHPTVCEVVLLSGAGAVGGGTGAAACRVGAVGGGGGLACPGDETME